MDAIVRVVRIYGSKSQYRDGDKNKLALLETSDYPVLGDTLRVWFGAVPDEIAHQLEVSYGQSQHALEQLDMRPSRRRRRA